MKAFSYRAAATAVLGRLRPVLLCLFALGLAACSTTGSSDSATPAVIIAGESSLAYGTSLTLPVGWQVTGSISPQAASKESLDSRRRNNERVLLLESLGPAGPRGLESMIAVFVVNEQGTFMPREYAERLTPNEFDALGKDLLAREKASAKKQKTKSGLLDVQVSRDSIGGKLAISQRMLVTGQDGKPVRLMNWDVYMPNGAGIAVKTVCDPENPNAENQIRTAIKSMRIQ